MHLSRPQTCGQSGILREQRRAHESPLIIEPPLDIVRAPSSEEEGLPGVKVQYELPQPTFDLGLVGGCVYLCGCVCVT